MRLKNIFTITYLCFFLILSCTTDSEIKPPEEELIEIIDDTETEVEEEDEEEENTEKSFQKILSLGDSYTIGQSVCETCRFPEQLKERLKLKTGDSINFELRVIATTGWTTTNLKNAIANENVSGDYDLVTLLIGVNNEYQKKPFSIYETEFPELVRTAISKAFGNKNNIIVVSIPDYAFTPFGNGNENISKRLDRYNEFARAFCKQNDISYVYITDITRQGLTNNDLVASDGLHPSKLAYSMFVDKMFPFALEKLND